MNSVNILHTKLFTSVLAFDRNDDKVDLAKQNGAEGS
jgi:hypothetical protein